MKAFTLTHYFVRGLFVTAIVGFLFNLYQLLHLEAIAPYGLQSLLFFNAATLLLALMFLESSSLVIYFIGVAASLLSISLTLLCFSDVHQWTSWWNYILFTSAFTISLAIFERIRKKKGSLALLSMFFCVFTLCAFGIILALKLHQEFILSAFWYLALLSILLNVIAIVFYARKDQSTKVP